MIYLLKHYYFNEMSGLPIIHCCINFYPSTLQNLVDIREFDNDDDDNTF